MISISCGEGNKRTPKLPEPPGRWKNPKLTASEWLAQALLSSRWSAHRKPSTAGGSVRAGTALVKVTDVLGSDFTEQPSNT